MNKEQFVTLMNKKLQVIKEEERKDIIDEYINHIDMKVSEGKSEEEAIADFGDIDEMVKEILDAYNIDPNRANYTNDHKINDFMDKMFDGFKGLLGSVTSMDADNIIRLVFEVLVIIILLGILRIPFSMIASLGSSLLDSILGFGIGHTLGWIWKVLINLVYLITFVVVLVNICTTRVRRYREHNADAPIMDDFKESFNFQRAKEAVHRFTEGSESYTREHSDEDIEDEIEKEYAYQSKQQNEKTYAYSGGQPSISESIGGIFGVILKIFGFLFMLPFFALMVGLCCALGFMVILSLQGVSIWGFYLIVIGAIVGTNSVLSLIYRSLCKGGRFE